MASETNAAGADRQLVADQLAAAAGENRRAFNKACTNVGGQTQRLKHEGGECVCTDQKSNERIFWMNLGSTTKRPAERAGGIDISVNVTPPTELKVFRADGAPAILPYMENESSAPLRPIAAVELDAVRNLESQLKDHLQANSDVYNFIGLVLSGAPDARLPDVTQARKVTTCLLVRIANDLRCIGHVSIRGYADQACALAASVYEGAFAVMAIGEDEGLAQDWIDHPDPNQLFRPIRQLTLMGMKSLGIPEPDQQANRWYLTYSQLCMAKHLNPLLQATRGFRVEANRVLVVTGPDTSQESVRLASFALEHSAGLALTAAGFFGQKYVHGPSQKELAAVSRELHEVLGNLRAAAVARGWDKNPFPDHWKIDNETKIGA